MNEIILGNFVSFIEGQPFYMYRFAFYRFRNCLSLVNNSKQKGHHLIKLKSHTITIGGCTIEIKEEMS